MPDTGDAPCECAAMTGSFGGAISRRGVAPSMMEGRKVGPLVLLVRLDWVPTGGGGAEGAVKRTKRFLVSILEEGRGYN